MEEKDMKSLMPEVVSETEKKIILLIAKEVPNKEIASILNYSQRMVEYKISCIFKKLNVKTRVGIVTRAFQMGIICPKMMNFAETRNTNL
jgi:DNA-binding CsgD family transcriptional regulator